VPALLPWIALVLALCSAALWKPIPRSQSRFRAAFGFLVLWLALWGAMGVASYWPDNPLNSDVARNVALALVELAAIQVVAGLIFDFAVEKTGVPRFAAEMLVVICYIVICFKMFYGLGVNVTGIFATSAVVTAVIGLSLQDMLSNIASGIALEFESDIRVGDYIKCGDSAGWVQHVRLRHTAIETPDGDRIMLPNSFLTRSPVTLIPPVHRHFIPFNMPYARNPQEMIDAVTDALRSSPIKNVAPEPAPLCMILEMVPGHIRYAAVVWLLLPGKEPPTTSAVLNRIYFSLKRAGIPVSEISNLLEMMPEGQARGEATTPIDILRLTPIFRLLSDAELSQLGAHLHHLSFAPGELIIRQSDDGASMYFITSGTVAITYVGADRIEHQVARMEAGDFFGEMSLLTGEVRGANAVALTRVDCYKLDKTGLEGTIARRPELAEDISVVMAHREAELNAVREKEDPLKENESQFQLLTRIRRFFAIDNSPARGF
jgi:small-conductance mechanosensitive channel/CRP-like cAMP-binding protein